MFKVNSCPCCKCIKIICILLAILSGFILFMYIVDCFYNYIQFTYRETYAHSSSHPELYIDVFHTVGVMVLTLIIAWIAWFQLKGLQKTAHGDFLIKIDDSFRNKNIQNALSLIYLLDRHSKVSCGVHRSRNPYCSRCEGAVTEDMKNQLNMIRDSDKKKDINDRFTIKVYLDHLETLSYFVNAGYITLDDVKNIHGGIIKYHIDELFCDWIENVRKNDPNAYSELLKLCKKLPA